MSEFTDVMIVIEIEIASHMPLCELGKLCRRNEQ